MSEATADDDQHDTAAANAAGETANPLSPVTRRLAYRVLRENDSHARRAYGTPRIEASYLASEGEAVPLREVRARRCMSISALAHRSGISISTIHRIEHGDTVPKPHVVRAISAALGVAPWQIAEFQQVLAAVGLPRPTVLAT